MVRCTQRTLFMVDLDLHRQLNVAYTPITNTTLNEKFGVLPGENIPARTWPYLTGYVIGIGGNPVIEGYQSYAFNEHTPMDGALFTHVPFIVRDYNLDLTAEEKANYRMRVVETINNQQYVCYYMKKVTDYELNRVFYNIKTINDGKSVASPTLSVLDTNVSSILNPTPKNRSVSYQTRNDAEYMSKLAKIRFELTETELEEIKRGIEIKGFQSSIITEIGLCTGVDIESTEGYTESIATQIAYHIPISFDLATEIVSGKTLTKQIELGGMEPYLA